MYSIAMMAALTSSAEAPDCRRSRRCNACPAPVVYVYKPCTIVVPHQPMTKPDKKDPPKKDPPKKDPPKKDPKKTDLGGKSDTMLTDGSTSPGSATILVKLPAEATLTMDGITMRSTGAERRFVTSGLRPGTTYTFTFAASRTIEGRRQTVTERVELQVGKTAEVRLEFATSVAVK